MIQLCGKSIHITGRMPRIAHVEGSSYESVDNPQAIVDGLLKSGTGVDLFTFMQIMPDTSPKYSYPMEWDNLAVLPISTFDHWWAQQIDGKTRNMVRRAEKKGLVVCEVPFDDILVRGIHEIYNECPIRQGRPFDHYGKDIHIVHKEAATFMESSIFLAAFLEGKIIGFAKLTTDQTRRQAGVMHILSMVQHRDKAPTNALMAQAVKSCSQRGIPHLVYSKFSYGAKERDSLSDFKQSNGFERIDLPRYYVGFTIIGRLAFCLGLHHGLLHHLPQPLLNRLREFRNAMYNRKPQSPSATS